MTMTAYILTRKIDSIFRARVLEQRNNLTIVFIIKTTRFD